MATCLDCDGAAACDCFVVGAGLVTVTGTGTEEDPYVASVTCAAVEACVGPMLASIGFGTTFTAGGSAFDLLTASGTGTASFLPF